MIELLDKVITHNSSLEVIKLFLEQDKQEKFTSALIDFRAECPAIDKQDAGQNLAGETYDYAKLEKIQEVIDPILHRHKLTYKFNQKQRGNLVTVQCLVLHVSGWKESTTMSAEIHETDALVSEQKTATTTSYLKRYTLTNALGLVIKGQDTDGNHQKRFDFNSTKVKGGAQGLREAVEATEKTKVAHGTVIDEVAPDETLEIKNGDKEVESLVSALEKGWTEAGSKVYELTMSLEESKEKEFTEAVQMLADWVLIHDCSQIAGFAKLVISADEKVSEYVSKTIGEVCEDWELTPISWEREE